MEQEARDILRAALDEESTPVKDLASAIRARFEPLGGVGARATGPRPYAGTAPVRWAVAAMIVVDTNVVSELMLPRPAAAVIDWASAQVIPTLYLTTISEASCVTALRFCR